jgi:hypothetical protein
MKKLISLMIVLCGLVLFADAQVRITPMAGYLLSGRMHTPTGDFKYSNDFMWGGSLGYKFSDYASAEFTYLRSDSEMKFRYNNGTEENLGGASADYFLIGSMTEKPLHERFAPFIQPQIGAARFSSRTPGVSDEWMFAVSVAGGLNVRLLGFMLVRAEARLLAPMKFNGVGFWCSTGGCDIGISSWSQFIQGYFGGGLIFEVGGK